MFVKILIAEKGFYYQTKPSNGKYYNYSVIKEAWISSGKTLNGTSSDFCNFRTFDGEVIKFSFFPVESDGIDYLLKRVQEETIHNYTENIDNNYQEYIIDGKRYGKASIIIALVLLITFSVLNVSLIQYGVPIVFLGSGIVFSLAILIVSIIRYSCLKIQIGNKGFYFQSNPFNGKYYKYSDIKSCKEVLKVYRHRGSGTQSPNKLYYYYFIFTDKNGRTKKFQFEKPIHEHEIQVLTMRIENAKNDY